MHAILALAALVVSPMDLSVDARYDLTCVEAATWAMSWMEDKSEAHNNVQLINWFYLGRLSGRDASTNWIKALRTDMAQNRKPESYYKEALESCTSRATDKLMADAGHR